MRREQFCLFRLVGTGAIFVALVALGSARAQGPNNDFGNNGGHGQQWPVYQRSSSGWSKHQDFRDRGRKHDNRFMTPQVNSGWFQRPYPYHLDYYKMKYGGSYAPYFGNLYGPPQVVTAPPYYGQYYGEFIGPGGGAYQNGFPAFQNGVMFDPPVEHAVPTNPAVTPPNGDTLPTP